MAKKQESLFGPSPEQKSLKKRAVKAFSRQGQVSDFISEHTDNSSERETVQKPLSVAEFIALLNEQLRAIDVTMTGEVSRVSSPPSGHVYFSLKDEKGESVIDCVIWKSQYDILGVALEAGMRVVIAGHADVYGPTGKLSFKVRAMELAGEGLLKKKYEELKKKLGAEGVFSEDRKRPIPEYPQHIGIVTSRNGAVIHDILNNLGRFGFKVTLADARVEGPEAVQSLIAAIRMLKSAKIDVLVIARGGGSLEALQAFDNEAVVREIVAFPLPVIAGIGHHQDVPLAALAADAHASTPTAVANILNSSWREALFKVQRNSQQVFGVYQSMVVSAKHKLDAALYAKMFVRIALQGRKMMNYSLLTIVRSFSGMTLKTRENIKMMERIVAANDPARNLRLGYSIIRKNGKVIKTIKAFSEGDRFDLQLRDGIMEGEVKKTEA